MVTSREIAIGNRAAEIDLLVLCSRRRFEPYEQVALRETLAQPLDWRFILNTASRHGLLALLLASIKNQNCLSLLPGPVAPRLQSAVRETTARTLALTGELTRILRVLSDAGLAAMPCKGPVVALMAYGDIAFRSFCDLDILVARQDLERARHLLASLGYHENVAFNAQQERDYLKNECALQLRNDQLGHIVELHWRFSERNASVDLPVASFWRRAQTLQIAGITVPTLCPEDLVLYLCVHGAKHRWERLEWIACLAEVIRSYPALDWRELTARAERYRIARLVNLGLYLAGSLLACALPPDIQNRLQRDQAAVALSHWVRARLFCTDPPESYYQQRAARYWFLLRSREHWADRFRIILYSAIRPPHPADPEWIELPPKLAFLHHVFRPVRLLSQYGAVAWNHYVRAR